jgi:pimeloyl-ACP methyl ester carboxylesterase
VTDCGYVPGTGMFYEVLGEPAESTYPWVMIPGGGATGVSFRVTPDGRPGWAPGLAARGRRCWVTDWPGTGRSGGVDPLGIDYEFLVDGYVRFLREVVRTPCVLVCHSMGGAIAWRVVEEARPLVAGVLSLAASYPGNIGPTADIVRDDGTTVVLRHPDSGLEFEVRRDAMWFYSDAYIEHQGVATSTRFPRSHIDTLRRSLVGIPPKVTLQRLGADGGLPHITDTSSFEGLWVRDVIGTEDPAHTPDVEQPTVDLLNAWGADAQLLELADRGIVGNGHYLFAESNSEEILDVLVGEASGLEEQRGETPGNTFILDY